MLRPRTSVLPLLGIVTALGWAMCWAGALQADDVPSLLMRAYEQGTAATNAAQMTDAIGVTREALEGELSETDAKYGRHLLAWQLTRRGRMALEAAGDADGGKRQAALNDFNEAIAADPTYVNGRLGRAVAHQRLGQWGAACDDLRVALQQAPEDPTVLRAAAWLLATAPDERFRDEKLALAAAQRAVELARERDFRSLDVAAAAQANAGNYTEAARLGHRAIQMSRQSATPAEQAAISRRVERYHRQLPYRQAPVAGSETPSEPSTINEEPESAVAQDIGKKQVKR
ncbi:MAG: hypothetical protein JSS27_20420 [Planctomycetes bacterium]|nr:hypothetical protein [Planctomycetota bacterium]